MVSRPPLGDSHCPVTNEASPEARKRVEDRRVAGHRAREAEDAGLAARVQ
jgi:hypothetical protein